MNKYTKKQRKLAREKFPKITIKRFKLKSYEVITNQFQQDLTHSSKNSRHLISSKKGLVTAQHG